MARNPGLRLPVLFLPVLVFTLCAQGSGAQQSAPALAQLTPGQISTVAGMPYNLELGFGYSGDGGPATSAEMFSPEGLAIDAAGNLYIADSGNSLIRVVNRQTTAITILGITIQPGDIQTIAGTYSSTLLGGFGGDGGPATQSTLFSPFSLLFDKAGNLYIADAGNGRVRVINMQSTPITAYGVAIPPGGINTVAGDTVNNIAVICAASTDDVGDGCPATQAALISPVGLSLDSAGNLYIADYGDTEYGDSRIRKVSAATGVISTAAGDGIEGYSGDGGNPLDAEIDDPESVAVDAAGNIYISDFGNNRVRVVNTQSSAITVFGVTIQPNTIQTVAGNGNTGFSGDGVQANQTSLTYPEGLWINAAGDLYIVDRDNRRIRCVNAATGIITTLAGDGAGLGAAGASGVSGDGGPATAAALAEMGYLALDSDGDIFVSEDGREVVREISGSTGVVTFPTTIPGSSASPQAVTVENIGNATLNLSGVSLEGTDAASFSESSTCGSSLAAGATCTLTVGFSPDASENLSATISISDNSAISPQRILLSGTGANTDAAQLSISPTQLSFGTQTVGTISSAQTITLTNTGTGPFTPGADSPNIVNLIGASPGDYIETDTCGDSLLPGASCTVSIRFAPESAVTATAFAAFEGEATNAPLQALLSGNGTTAGGASSQPLLQIFPGVVSTVAGDGFDAGMAGEHGGYTGLGGPAVGAELQGPTGVTNDTSGNIYFSSGNNNVIQIVNMQSAAVTVAGVSVQPGDLQTLVGDAYGAGLGTGGYSGDGGPALSAELNQPVNPVLDKSGNIYFSDLNNNVVRVVNTQSSAIVINGVTIAPNDIQTVAGLSLGGSVCTQATDPVGDGCPASSARLDQPEQLAFDSAGNLYIADSCDMVVRAVNMGTSPAKIAGVTIQPGQIQIVAGTLASNSGSGCSKESFGGDGGPALSATFDGPVALAVDPAGNLYIGDAGNFRIRAVNTQSKAITIFGVTIQPGDVETVVANGTEGYSGDFGPATSAEISIVESLALDPADNLYLADTVNNVVRVVFASNGMIRTVAGNGYGAAQYANGKVTSYSGGYTGNGGPATSAEFFGPDGVSIDSYGNTYIADLFNKVVRQVSATAAAFNFPDTQVGTTSASQIYTLSNISAQTIRLTALTISTNFTQVPSGLTDCTANTSLAPGTVCQLALAFAPTTTGLLQGEAQITDNAGVQSILLSGEGTPKTEVALQSIRIAPSGASLATGASQQFMATGTYSDGSTQTITNSVTWSSSSPAVAKIGIASGLATAVGGGTTQITANAGSISSSAVTLTVTSPTLKSIAVTPANPSVTIGGTQQFTATGTYSDGSTQTITTTVTWSSSSSSVATIGASTGLATGVAAGSTQIVATLGSISSSAVTLTVTSPTLSSQTITVTQAAPASAAYSATFNVSATASSGLAVAITTSGACSGAGTSTSGSAVAITMTAGTGTCTVYYNQAGNGTYSAAPQVTSTTTAAQASQTITVTTAAPASAADNSTFPVAATASSSLPVSIATSGACTGSGRGSATVTMTAATGTCTVTYSQAGNGTYSAAPQVTSTTTATSGTGTPAPTFTLSSPTGAQSAQPGASVQYTITATAQNGTFSSAVTLAASGLPAGATAAFSPPSITPGSSSASSTLTIQTAGTTAAATRTGSPWPLAAPALAFIGLFFLPGRRRRRWVTLALLLTSLSAFAAFTACGGGFGMSAAGPSASYTITVTGSSGSVQQTTTVQLTVE